MIDLTEGKYAKYLAKGKKKNWPEEAKTASAEYLKTYKEMKANLSKINKAMDTHMAKQRKDPMDWGWAGDLSRSDLKLKEALEVLK